MKLQFLYRWLFDEDGWYLVNGVDFGLGGDRAVPFHDIGGNIMERVGKGDRHFAGMKWISTVYKAELAEVNSSVKDQKRDSKHCAQTCNWLY